LSALKRAQVDTRCIDMPDREAGQFDSESLWGVVAAQVRPGFRVLIVREKLGLTAMHLLRDGAGRDWFADRVRAAGGEASATSVMPEMDCAATGCRRFRCGCSVFGRREPPFAQAGMVPGRQW
jgi:hypothetical protein